MIVSDSLAIFVDRKRVSEKTWTADRAKAVPVMVAAGPDSSSRAVFGFSSWQAMEEWVDRENMQSEYAKIQNILRRVATSLSRTQSQEIRALQSQVVADHTRAFELALDTAHVDRRDAQALSDFVCNYAPERGPIVQSVFLFEGTYRTNSMRYMPKNWAWPNLQWLSFNDMCSSLSCWLTGVLLCEHVFYGGRRIWFPAGPSFPAMQHYGDLSFPFFFDNVASSAIS